MGAKNPKESMKMLMYTWHQTLKKFQKESPAVEEYYFNAYVVKKDKSDMCIVSVSVWQEPSHRPSIADWRRDCSPEGTPVIPREWYVSSFVFKSQETEKLKDSIHTGSSLFNFTRNYFYSFQIEIYWIAANYSREFEYHHESTIYLNINCARSENLEVKPSNWLISQTEKVTSLNISEMTSGSPLFIKAKL